MSSESVQAGPTPSALGNRSLLKGFKACVLNSSQSMFPVAADPWVRGTVSAIDFIAAQGWTLVSSIGVKTWDLACYLADRSGVPQVVLVPASSSGPADFERLCLNFGLNPALVCAIPVAGSRNEWPSVRDRTALALSNALFPVSIRENGKLSGWLQGRDVQAKLDSQFRLPWGKLDRVPRYQFDVDRIRREVDPLFQDHLIHWTRASDGPWPGESSREYFQDLFSGEDAIPRSAARTLARILKEGRIRGSAWRIRGKDPVVAFSSLLPSAAVTMMKIGVGGGKHFLEPFGIALSLDSARGLGIEPVVYTVERGTARGDIPKYLMQSNGRRSQWPEEKEWRALGDIELASLPQKAWKPIDLTAYTVE